MAAPKHGELSIVDQTGAEYERDADRCEIEVPRAYTPVDQSGTAYPEAQATAEKKVQGDCPAEIPRPLKVTDQFGVVHPDADPTAAVEFADPNVPQQVPRAKWPLYESSRLPVPIDTTFDENTLLPDNADERFWRGHPLIPEPGVDVTNVDWPVYPDGQPAPQGTLANAASKPTQGCPEIPFPTCIHRMGGQEVETGLDIPMNGSPVLLSTVSNCGTNGGVLPSPTFSSAIPSVGMNGPGLMYSEVDYVICDADGVEVLNASFVVANDDQSATGTMQNPYSLPNNPIPEGGKAKAEIRLYAQGPVGSSVFSYNNSFGVFGWSMEEC